MARALILVHKGGTHGFRFPPRHFRSEHRPSPVVHDTANLFFVLGYPEYLVVLDTWSRVSRIER